MKQSVRENLRKELLVLHENNINEGLFDKAKEFFLKTFQKGEYRYKAIDLLLKSIERDKLHNGIDLDKEFKEYFKDLRDYNTLFPESGRIERLKKLSDYRFKNLMSIIKGFIDVIENRSENLKTTDKETADRKKAEEDRKKAEEERRDKQKKLDELWSDINDKVLYVNYYETLSPFYNLFNLTEGKGSGKHSSDSVDETLKEVYRISNKNVNREIDTSPILNEVKLVNERFQNYVNLYKEIYDKTPDEKLKIKKETDDDINQILQKIKQYKTYKEIVLSFLTEKKLLVNHKGKIVYHGSSLRDLEADNFNNTINAKKRTGYGLYTSPQLKTACRYAFAYIFGDLSKGGKPLKANLGGKANIYRIELGDMPFLLRLDPNIDKEELDMLIAFGIGGYDGFFKDANEIEISISTSDNIAKSDRITNSNYPTEFKEMEGLAVEYIKRYGHEKYIGDYEKFIRDRLSENFRKELLVLHESDQPVKKSYLGQCDLVRRECDVNEVHWHEMMENRKQIPFEKFIRSVDMTSMLDDDETPEGYIQDAIRQDSETATYISNWGDQEAMFLQVAGFEFIFV